MNKKLIYLQTDFKTDGGLPWWKCLHDEDRTIYEELNGKNTAVIFWI